MKDRRPPIAEAINTIKLYDPLEAFARIDFACPESVSQDTYWRPSNAYSLQKRGSIGDAFL